MEYTPRRPRSSDQALRGDFFQKHHKSRTGTAELPAIIVTTLIRQEKGKTMGLLSIRLIAGMLLLFMSSRSTADVMWNVAHTATGSSFAQKHDGGSGDSDTDSTNSTTDFGMYSSAVDTSNRGALGALASARALSSIEESMNELVIRQSVETNYFSSFFPGGAGPGGSANADLTAIIEFVLPRRIVELRSRLAEDNRGDARVVINWNTTIENVTAGTTILTLSSPVDDTYFDPFALSLISGNVGDSIRISTLADATLSGPPGLSQSFFFNYELDLRFTPVPEPGTTALGLIGLGVFGLATNRRFLPG